MNGYLAFCLVFLALLLTATAAAAIRGPRFTDRLVAISLLTNLTLSMICILTVYLGEDFLLDVALLYALVSFVTVAVLSRLITRDRLRRSGKEDGQ